MFKKEKKIIVVSLLDKNEDLLEVLTFETDLKDTCNNHETFALFVKEEILPKYKKARFFNIYFTISQKHYFKK